MRKIFALLLVLNCQFIISQTEEDYTKALTTIVEMMNSKNGQELFDQFTADLQSSISLEQLNGLIAGKIEELGALSDYDFMDEDEIGKRYLVQTENDSLILVIKLSAENKISVFKIE